MPENGFAVLEGISSGKWRCSDEEAAEVVSKVREEYCRKQ
jgi:hypothetical protein